MNFNLIAKKLFEKYARRAFAIRGKGDSNVDAKMDAKNKGFYQKRRIFDRIKLSNIQKNRVFMLPYSHNYPILVRSTGIEDVRQLLKAFIYKAFLR